MVNGKPTVISLFSGCGGSSLGYGWAGFREILAVDFDGLAVETFRLNFPDVPCWQRDVREVTGREIMEFCGISRGELDLLDASPPCQGFSLCGKQEPADSRNDLSSEFARLVDGLRPRAFIMENVKGMIRGAMKGWFIEITKRLKSLPYLVKCRVMDAANHGVPQHRPRLIWEGIRDDLGREPEFPEPEGRQISVKEAIGDLPVGVPGRHRPEILEAWERARAGIPLRKASPFVGSFQSYRLNPRRPAPTMIANHTHWHWLVPRRLTVAESKRICGFPDDFRFVCPDRRALHLLGNAVMPRFMEAIARTVKEGILDHAPIS